MDRAADIEDLLALNPHIAFLQQARRNFEKLPDEQLATLADDVREAARQSQLLLAKNLQKSLSQDFIDVAVAQQTDGKIVLELPYNAGAAQHAKVNKEAETLLGANMFTVKAAGLKLV